MSVFCGSSSEGKTPGGRSFSCSAVRPRERLRVAGVPLTREACESSPAGRVCPFWCVCEALTTVKGVLLVVFEQRERFGQFQQVTFQDRDEAVSGGLFYSFFGEVIFHFRSMCFWRECAAVSRRVCDT